MRARLAEQAGLLQDVGGVLLGPHHELGGLLHVAPPPVQVEQRQHAGHVGGIDGERLHEALLRDLRHAHLLVEDPAQPEVEVDLLPRVGQRDEPAHGIFGPLPLLGLLVQAGHAPQGLDVGRLGRQHVGVGLDGPLGIAQLLLVDLAHLQVELDALVGVVGDEDVVAVVVGQGVPAPLGPVQALEVAVGPLVAGVDQQHLLQAVDGPIGLVEGLLPDLGHAGVEGHPLLLRRGRPRARARAPRGRRPSCRSSRTGARGPSGPPGSGGRPRAPPGRPPPPARCPPAALPRSRRPAGAASPPARRRRSCGPCG